MKKLVVFFFAATIITGLVFSVPAFAEKPGGLPNHEIIVSQDGNGDFATIWEALDSIPGCTTDPVNCPSDTNRYRLTLKPGIYADYTIDLPSFVDIYGSGPENTTITSDTDSNSLRVLGNSTVADITVKTNYVTTSADSVVDVDSGAEVVFNNVTVEMPTNANIRGIDCNGSSLQLLNSRLILPWVETGINLSTDVGVKADSGCDSLLISDSVVEMYTRRTNIPVAIYSSNTNTEIKNSKVIITGLNGVGGVYGDNIQILNSVISTDTDQDGMENNGIYGNNIEIINSKITAHSMNPTQTAGVYVTGANVTIMNSVVSSSMYGIYKSSDITPVYINNSTISGNTFGIYKANSDRKFFIGNSQIIGGHNGVAGTDKIINCYDGDYEQVLIQ